MKMAHRGDAPRSTSAWTSRQLSGDHTEPRDALALTLAAPRARRALSYGSCASAQDGVGL